MNINQQFELFSFEKLTNIINISSILYLLTKLIIHNDNVDGLLLGYMLWLMFASFGKLTCYLNDYAKTDTKQTLKNINNHLLLIIVSNLIGLYLILCIKSHNTINMYFVYITYVNALLIPFEGFCRCYHIYCDTRTSVSLYDVCYLIFELIAGFSLVGMIVNVFFGGLFVLMFFGDCNNRYELFGLMMYGIVTVLIPLMHIGIGNTWSSNHNLERKISTIKHCGRRINEIMIVFVIDSILYGLICIWPPISAIPDVEVAMNIVEFTYIVTTLNILEIYYEFFEIYYEFKKQLS